VNIRLLEELSLNAWPALHTLTVDGWLVRFANGYTRRANSVNPLYAPAGNVNDNIAACEALYAARGLPTVFKLTPDSQPPDLDDLLAQRGYTREAETSVQTLALGDASRLQGAPTQRAPTIVSEPAHASRVQPRDQGRRAPAAAHASLHPHTSTPPYAHTSAALTDEWFAAHTAISGLASAHHATARTMLTMLSDVQSVGAKHSAPADLSEAAGAAECFAPTFALLVEAGQPVACGLAVAERGSVGCFDIAVHPAHRRKGHARRLMLDLLAWGQAQGAHTAYLQVMCNNAAALGLYAGLGFAEQYRYWYRVKGA